LTGILLAAVTDSLRSVGIVAMQDVVHPSRGIGGQGGNRFDRVALGVHQANLPMRPFNGVMRPAVALVQIINQQVVGYRSLSHTLIDKSF
jgi:hypothetical protein